jgi:hypothetical protein
LVFERAVLSRVANYHDHIVCQTGFLVHNIDCDCNPIFDPNDLHPDTVTPENPKGLYPIEPTGSYRGTGKLCLTLRELKIPEASGPLTIRASTLDQE